MDALAPFGVVHIDMPLKPEKLWAAMHAKHGEERERDMIPAAFRLRPRVEHRRRDPAARRTRRRREASRRP